MSLHVSEAAAQPIPQVDALEEGLEDDQARIGGQRL
jgi:hypothetical protein